MAWRQLLAAAGACVVLAASTPFCFAQQWPARTVKVVVPYGVGGVTDTMARVTADRLGKMLNQTFVIENKPGAGGAIGVDYVLHSPQDGYTILFIGSTLFTVLPLAQKVNYEPLKDLIPVSITGTNGMVLVVAKDAPYSTLREFIDYARANPGKITYSSGGPATNNHLSTAYLAGKEKSGYGACAVQRRPGRADGRTLEIGGHAFRQLIRFDRTGEKRHRESPCRLDARTNVATSECPYCR